MKQNKGNPNPVSRKGKPNKVTADVRAVIAGFAERNAHKVEEWINAVAAGNPVHGRPPDPGKAVDLYLRAIEYHIPKLGRTELTGKDGKALTMVVQPRDLKLLGE